MNHLLLFLLATMFLLTSTTAVLQLLHKNCHTACIRRCTDQQGTNAATSLVILSSSSSRSGILSCYYLLN